MKYGLNDATLEKIRSVFARFPAIEKAVLYGSRAKGNFKTGSDIDLTLYGEALTPDLRDTIATALDDLLLPYSIDLSLFDALDHAKLREHIERVGVVFYEQANQAAAIKNGWPSLPLNKVCQIKPPKSEARERVPAHSLVSFLPMEDMGIDEKFVRAIQERPLSEVQGSYTYFSDGDVLLAKITPCFENGKLGIAEGLTNGIGFGSSEYLVFRSDKTLSKEWLYYYLSRETFRVEGAERMSGAVGHKRVSKEFIENYLIPIPPLPEQRRIVGILDEAFTGIATAKANAEKNLQNARALFESHLHSVFADAWQSSELVTLADLATDITDGDHLPPPKAPTGVPFITIGNIVKETRQIDFSETFMVPQAYFDALKPHKKPRTGDVLYTVTGSFGIPVIVNGNTAFCFQRHIGLIRPKPDTKSAWLYYLLLSPQVFKQANDGATGTAQKTVSLKLLRSLVVPKVSLYEQQGIVAKLNALTTETQRLEAIYQQKLAALDELKKSLLHQAFTGAL